jgi:hypothetical protein
MYSSEEINAQMRRYEQHRPYIELCKEVSIRMLSVEEYYKSALNLLSAAEDLSDLESVVGLFAKADKKSKLMTQLLVQEINSESDPIANEPF